MIFALALVVLGALVGLLTVALSVAVGGGASLFAERPQLVWLLPVTGLCSYGAYRAVGLDFSWSTARVMEAVRDGRSVPPLLAPAIIVGTALTVLCGGSVGKEAAALQMGAAASGLLRGRVSARFRTVLAPAAMGAALGAMLDAPLAGVVFSFEALRRRPDSFASLAAPAVTSLVSWGVVRAMGVRFLPGSVAAPAVLDVVFAGDSFMGDRVAGALLLLAAVGAAAGLLTLAFCGALEKLRGSLARLGAPVFALAVGGVATALVVGYADLFHYEDVRSYCGTGLSQIEAALAGEALPWWAFIVKAALTLLTLAGGFKGGEIMPVLATGACLGAAVFSAASPLLPASILGAVGASRSLGALVGMVAFFAACTNCPLTALAFAGGAFRLRFLARHDCCNSSRLSDRPPGQSLSNLLAARARQMPVRPRFGVSRCQLRGALAGNASSTPLWHAPDYQSGVELAFARAKAKIRARALGCRLPGRRRFR